MSHTIMNIITTFFDSRFSEQSTTVQARQPVFVKLLQGAYRLSHCDWLTGVQKYHVESCIKTLSEIGMYPSTVIGSYRELLGAIGSYREL